MDNQIRKLQRSYYAAAPKVCYETQQYIAALERSCGISQRDAVKRPTESEVADIANQAWLAAFDQERGELNDVAELDYLAEHNCASFFALDSQSAIMLMEVMGAVVVENHNFIDGFYVAWHPHFGKAE